MKKTKQDAWWKDRLFIFHMQDLPMLSPLQSKNAAVKYMNFNTQRMSSERYQKLTKS